MNTTHTILAHVLCIFACTFPTIAKAQDKHKEAFDEHPSVLPKPLYERQQVSERTTHGTTQDTTQDTTQTDAKTWSWTQLVPSAGVAVVTHVIDPKFQKPGFALWGGAKLYPWLASWSPMVGLRAHIEHYNSAQDNPNDLWLTSRLGVSWIHGSRHNHMNTLLPYMDLYTIVGQRMWSSSRAHATRLGLGISGPVFVPASLFMMLNGVPLPNNLEVTIDLNHDTHAVDVVFILGIGI